MLCALLCAALGGIFGMATMYSDVSDTVVKTYNLTVQMEEIRMNEAIMRDEIVKLTLAVDRLANELCYMRTDAPCARVGR